MKTTSILGISMTRRSRRRMLVSVVYLLLAMLVSVAVVFNHGHSLVRPGNLTGFSFLFMLSLGVSGGIFGRLVGQFAVPISPPQERDSRSLPVLLFGHLRKPAADVPDERDLAVRNRAYFLAFRVIAVYSALLWITYATLGDLVTKISLTLSLNMATLLLFPLIVMALTLPQAVLLWSEPNLPTADEEFISIPVR